jgi:N utilization substance protein B
VLFEADQRRLDISRLAAERLEGESPVTEYARRVVAGVAANLTSIDETLETYSLGWPLARMPAVDRAIARLGVHEIVWADDVPDPVAMADAADMASELSTPKSADFLSGLLGRISAMKSGMAPASQPAEPD